MNTREKELLQELRMCRLDAGKREQDPIRLDEAELRDLLVSAEE